MQFKTFEEIAAWQEARSLGRIVRRLCVRAIAKHDWTWSDQISRAALSIMANIAEGNDATTNPEFIVFLGYAKRSAAEVRSHLYYGLDEKYVTKEEFDEASERTKKIGAQLAKLMKYLQQHDDNHRISKNASN
ncbi:four helix bundle protein, partial [Candidatus Peregrinibacteria bacterium]|nr:four helix bundle protein [Candidatus Peregrinibacteria bacterium]